MDNQQLNNYADTLVGEELEKFMKLIDENPSSSFDHVNGEFIPKYSVENKDTEYENVDKICDNVKEYIEEETDEEETDEEECPVKKRSPVVRRNKPVETDDEETDEEEYPVKKRSPVVRRNKPVETDDEESDEETITEKKNNLKQLLYNLKDNIKKHIENLQYEHGKKEIECSEKYNLEELNLEKEYKMKMIDIKRQTEQAKFEHKKLYKERMCAKFQDRLDALNDVLKNDWNL